MGLSKAVGPKAAPAMVSRRGRGRHLSPACCQPRFSKPTSVDSFCPSPLGSWSLCSICPSHFLSQSSEVGDATKNTNIHSQSAEPTSSLC